MKYAKINSTTTGTSMKSGGVRKNNVHIGIKKNVMNSIAIFIGSGTILEWMIFCIEIYISALRIFSYKSNVRKKMFHLRNLLNDYNDSLIK